MRSNSITYLALLRGINVGGNNKIPMAELRACLEAAGLTKVATYIQSGNVIFDSNKSHVALAELISACIKDRFGFTVPVAVFTAQEWQTIIKKAPVQWGTDPHWKHNLLIILMPHDMHEIIQNIGELKPDIEMLVPGDGVLYQSMSLKLFGKTTTGKLAAKPIYSRMTVRNYNTSRTLLKLLEERA